MTYPPRYVALDRCLGIDAVFLPHWQASCNLGKVVPLQQSCCVDIRRYSSLSSADNKLSGHGQCWRSSLSCSFGLIWIWSEFCLQTSDQKSIVSH